MEIFFLMFLCLLHWSLLIIAVSYAFWRRQQYDYIYFSVITVVLFGWIFNGGECIVSAFEKIILNCNYVWGSQTHYNPSLLLYKDLDAIGIGKIIYKICFNILFWANLVYILRTYKIRIKYIILIIVIICGLCITNEIVNKKRNEKRNEKVVK